MSQSSNGPPVVKSWRLPEAPPLSGAWWRTWQNNSNYRHGRNCRKRLRLEDRLRRAMRYASYYRGHTPKFAPFHYVRAWARLPVGVLPRRSWKAAVAFINQAWHALAYLKQWRAQVEAGWDPTVPPTVMQVIGWYFRFMKGARPPPPRAPARVTLLRQRIAHDLATFQDALGDS